MTIASEVLGICKSEKDNSSSLPPQSPHHVSTWSLSSRLQPSEMAAFSVTSRLLASIVTESLLRAYYIPIRSEVACGICVILSAHVDEQHLVVTRSLRPADIFAILPLHQEPVYSGTLSGSAHGRPIWLLDPLDMVPSIFEISTGKAGLIKNVWFIHRDRSLKYLLIYG